VVVLGTDKHTKEKHYRKKKGKQTADNGDMSQLHFLRPFFSVVFMVAFLIFRSFLVVCRFSSTPLSLVPCFCGTGSSDFEASGRSLTGCAFVGSVCTLSVVTGRLTSCIFPVSVLEAGEAVTGLSWGRVAPVVADPSVVLPACF